MSTANRPLSPHLQVYRPQITSVLSILHRMTGVALTLGLALLVWWFVAAAAGPDYFIWVDGVLRSPLGGLVMLGSAFALAYHTLNGIRHLVWDMGYGFDLDTVTTSGWSVVIGAIAITFLLWLFA